MNMVMRGITGVRQPVVKIPDMELGLLSRTTIQLMFRKHPDKMIALTDELVVVSQPRWPWTTLWDE